MTKRPQGSLNIIKSNMFLHHVLNSLILASTLHAALKSGYAQEHLIIATLVLAMLIFGSKVGNVGQSTTLVQT